MRCYFKPCSPTPTTPPLPSLPPDLMQTIDLTLEDMPWPTVNQIVSPKIFMGYLSDISDNESLPEDQDHEDNEKEDEGAGNTLIYLCNHPNMVSGKIAGCKKNNSVSFENSDKRSSRSHSLIK